MFAPLAWILQIICQLLQILICFTYLQYDKLWGLPRRVFTLLTLQPIWLEIVIKDWSNNTNIMFEKHKRIVDGRQDCWWKAIYGKHHLKTLKVVGQVNSHWTLQGLKIIIESSHTRWSTVVAEQSRCQSTRSWFWWPERAMKLREAFL